MDGLTLLDSTGVTGTGQRAGSGPLTLGQQNVAQWVGDKDHNFFAIVDLVLHLPGAVSLANVLDGLAGLVGRHESLRTRFVLEPEPRQHIMRSGDLPVDIYEVNLASYPEFRRFSQEPDSRTTISPETRVEGALIARLRETPFSLADGALARAAVAVAGGTPVAAAMVCSHMIVDLRAAMVLDRDFARLAAAPADATLTLPVHQPLDQAEMEQQPRRRRQAEAALRHWEDALRWLPQSVYAVPASAPDGPPACGWFRSAPISRVLPSLEARTGAPSAAVLTAALAAVVAWRTGVPRFAFRLIAHNRIGAHLHEYVGTIAQDCLVVVDTEVPSFDDLARACATATIRACRLGACDTARLIAVCKAIEHDRGIRSHRDAVLNHVGRHPLTIPVHVADAAAAELRRVLTAPRGEMYWWQPPVHQDILTEFRVIEFEGVTALGQWTWDPRRVPQTEIEQLLRGAERLLLAAGQADVPLAELTEVTGLGPVVRDPVEWVQLDSCWVELAEVQRLLDDALAPGVARLYVPRDGDPKLVAYLAASDRISTPQQAHAACLDGLGGRYTAMTPRWYIVCERAPSDPSDIAAWRRQPVLAEGDGRRVAAP